MTIKTNGETLVVVGPVPPVVSVSSLMVGKLDFDLNLDMALTLNSPVVHVSSLDNTSESDDVVTEFVKMVRQAWVNHHEEQQQQQRLLHEQPPPELTTISGGDNNPDRELYTSLLEKLLGDRPQLLRILIARKYNMEDSVSLLLEQLRFRARWKPQSIQPEDIPNALQCK